LFKGDKVPKKRVQLPITQGVSKKLQPVKKTVTKTGAKKVHKQKEKKKKKEHFPQTAKKWEKPWSEDLFLKNPKNLSMKRLVAMA